MKLGKGMTYVKLPICMDNLLMNGLNYAYPYAILNTNDRTRELIVQNYICYSNS